MTRQKVLTIAEGVMFYSIMLTFVLVVVSLVGCEFTKEIVLDPNGVPSGVERVVVEGPGGDMVGVAVDTVERFAPLLPEPWNSIVVALAAGFSAATAGWVFRSRKEKKANV